MEHRLFGVSAPSFLEKLGTLYYANVARTPLCTSHAAGTQGKVLWPKATATHVCDGNGTSQHADHRVWVMS